MAAIKVVMTSQTMGDEWLDANAAAYTWAEYVEGRLRDKFPGAEIDMRVNNRLGATQVDAGDLTDEVSAFLQDLWDRELSAVFG